MIVRTMQAPARMTSARAVCKPMIERRPAVSTAAITVDLSIDLGPIEDRPLDDVGIVRR